MSVVLLLSLAIRFSATVWSVVLMQRMRDRRMGALSLFLGLITAEQLLVAIVEGPSPPSIELPAFAVSVMAFIATFCLANFLEDRRRGEHERRRLESQLQRAQKLEALGQLAGGVAHDFNNVLTVIRGGVDLLRDAAAKGHLDVVETRAELDQIEHAVGRASGLTRQLLTFGHREEHQPETVDVNEMLVRLERMLSRLLPSEVRLRYALDEGLATPVQIDPGQLEMVVLNLVLNARDALPQGGEIVLRTRRDALDAEQARARANAHAGDYVVIEVTDTGTGMSDETMERAFEPFFTTKSPGKGTGLGLSTVYGMVVQAGGFATVDSELGQGTSIGIWLPGRVAGAPARPSARASAPDGGARTVLLCEDERLVREIAEAALRSHGYQVLAAETASEALERAREHEGPIHLLVTDLALPEMNGRQLAGVLQAQRPGTKVLFVSEHRQRGFGEAFLGKPFRSDQLLGRVSALLEGERESV